MQALTTPKPYKNHIPYIIHKEYNYKLFFEFQGDDKCYMQGIRKQPMLMGLV
jgi:hypothetical protein